MKRPGALAGPDDFVESDFAERVSALGVAALLAALALVVAVHAATTLLALAATLLFLLALPTLLVLPALLVLTLLVAVVLVLILVGHDWFLSVQVPAERGGMPPPALGGERSRDRRVPAPAIAQSGEQQHAARVVPLSDDLRRSSHGQQR